MQPPPLYSSGGGGIVMSYACFSTTTTLAHVMLCQIAARLARGRLKRALLLLQSSPRGRRVITISARNKRRPSHPLGVRARRLTTLMLLPSLVVVF